MKVGHPVKFLVDNACSPKLAAGLREAGYDAVHVLELNAAADSDNNHFDRAVSQGRTIITSDTDFGTLLAARGTPSPSVIQFRRRMTRRASVQLSILLAQLPALFDDLANGALVTIEDTRVRVRQLPILSKFE